MTTETPHADAFALLQQIRDLGFVVVAFTPEELRGADETRLEDMLISRGNEFIDDNATEPDIEALESDGYEVRAEPEGSKHAYAIHYGEAIVAYGDTEETAWQACYDYLNS